AGGLLPSVGTMRFVPARGVLRVDLNDMDPARFPNVAPAVRGGGAVAATNGCTATLSIGNVGPTGVSLLAAIAPHGGSAVTLKTTATSVSGVKGTIDVVCTFVDKTGATVTHQTHWTGTFA